MNRRPRRAGFLQRLGPGPRRATCLLAALPLPLQRGSGPGSGGLSRALPLAASPCATCRAFIPHESAHPTVRCSQAPEQYPPTSGPLQNLILEKVVSL